MTDQELSALTRGLSCCDESAWRVFHEQQFQKLHALVLSRGIAACDAAEVVQGVYLRVLRHAKVFHDEQAFDAWLSCLVRCEVIDTGRKKGRRNWLHERYQHWLESRRSPERDTLPDELERAMLDLDEPDRALIRSHYLDGWSQESLAAQRQVSVKAIESKLARLRKRLRETLNQQATPSS
jgi:RNA polymerase sigma factor (sigma-70 family)